MTKPISIFFLGLFLWAAPSLADELRGTGDLGIIIERATGTRWRQHLDDCDRQPGNL